MTISTIKDLSKLIDLCRKKGIDSVEIDNIKLKFGHLEQVHQYKDGPALVEDIKNDISYTPEDILNWSSAPLDGVG